MKAALMNSKILCRICKGDHWTTKCPFKDSKMASDALDTGFYIVYTGTDATAEAASKAASGKYVPPSQRAGGREGGGESMAGDRRDDYSTLRITNLSEDVQEGDIKELVCRFGQTARVFVARVPGFVFCYTGLWCVKGLRLCRFIQRVMQSVR